MGELIQDIRFTLRVLRKSPGVAITIIAILAVAIGSTSAIVSVVRTTIIDPLPVRRGDRLLLVESINAKTESRDYASAMTLAELRQRPDIFTNPIFFERTHLEFSGKEFREPLAGAWVSPNFFLLWGVSPMLGRTFAPDEGRAAANKVAVVSHSFWRNRLGSDPNVIGRQIQILGDIIGQSSEWRTVIGVMPQHFRFPDSDMSVWVPRDESALLNDPRAKWDRRMTVAFRLAESASVSQAQVVLDQVSSRQAVDESRLNAGWQMRLRPVSDRFADETVGQTLWALLAIIAIAWLLACANVAGLLIGRAEARQHEIAVRAALGASRARLLRQLLTESLLLAVAGALAGLAITRAGIAALEAFSGSALLRPFAMDWSVVAGSLGLALVTGIAFGVVPAWLGSRPRLHKTLQANQATATPAIFRRSLTSGLIVGQFALGAILLCAAGLMVHSVLRLLRDDLGYQAQRLIRIYAQTPYRTNDVKEINAYEKVFHEAIFRELCAVPGVNSVGILGGGNIFNREYIAQTVQHPVYIDRYPCGIENASPFATLGVSVIEGRLLDRNDVTRNTVVISQACAAALWPGESPLGKQFKSAGENWRDEDESWEVVGVVANFKRYGYGNGSGPVFYRPSEVEHGSGLLFNFYVRTSGDAAGMMQPIRQAIKRADADVTAPRIEIVADEFYRYTEPRRTFAFYLSLAAASGVVLSATGLHGMLAYSVVRRRREIGVRLALGATRKNIVGMILSQGMILTIAGILIGAVGAMGLTRLLQSFLFEVGTADPSTLEVMSVVLLGAALLACVIPATRAARLDPMTALRSE